MEDGRVEQWDALTNFGENIYPLLDRDFPNSKFILTIREKYAWLDSSKRQFEVSKDDHKYIRNYNENWTVIPTSWIRRMNIYGCVSFDDDIYSHFYDTHYRNVLYYFKNRPQDLIIMDICEGDGWSKLCDFLSCEIPSLDFPNKNKNINI